MVVYIEPVCNGGSKRLIPVALVTGFLGSGKTTLIRRLLVDPAFGRTAIIVNEFGEIGLDHEIISSSADSILTLNTGCLCCAIQTDLGRTLMELLDRREAGLVAYDRVLIETSGLADPAPILQAMMTDVAVNTTHLVPIVTTLVDTLLGVETIQSHTEARHQVALADRLLFSKTDLEAPSSELLALLIGLNPSAPRLATAAVDPAILFASAPAPPLPERVRKAASGGRHPNIQTFVITRDRPVPALALTLLLQALAEHCGSRLLRLKGLVAIEELPGQPAVVHGIRHVVNAPEILDAWPSAIETTRIVFIVQDVPQYFVSRLLDAIEEEVRDATLASSGK